MSQPPVEGDQARAAPDPKVIRKLQQSQARLDLHFEAGDYYEAQQVAKTLYRRAVLADALEFASNLVVVSTVRLIQAKQYLAASDLALLLLNCLEKQEGPAGPVSAQGKETIFKIMTAFPEGQEAGAISFGLAVVEWFGARQRREAQAQQAVAGGQKPPEAPAVGIPELHLRLARLYRRQQDFASAHKHYLRSGAPAEHAMLLQAWSAGGYRSERDLFVARAVLQSLCLQNLKHANTVFRLYVKSWERQMAAAGEQLTPEEDSLKSPLMNFIDFLLKTAERDAAPLFQTLRQKYAVSLGRDQALQPYLDRIGEIYFGIKAYRGMLDMLQDLL